MNTKQWTLSFEDFYITVMDTLYYLHEDGIFAVTITDIIEFSGITYSYGTVTDLLWRMVMGGDVVAMRHKGLDYYCVSGYEGKAMND